MKPTVNSRRARILFALLGDEAVNILGDLNDMTTAHTAQRDREFYEAAVAAGRSAVLVNEVLRLLSQGRFEEAEKLLGIEPK